MGIVFGGDRRARRRSARALGSLQNQGYLPPPAPKDGRGTLRARNILLIARLATKLLLHERMRQDPSLQRKSAASKWHQLLAQIRQGDSGSGVVTIGEAQASGFETTWGDGAFEVFRDRDEAHPDALLQKLAPRWFVVRNVHAKDEPMRLVQPRWAMSAVARQLKGPMTRVELLRAIRDRGL